MAVKTPFVPAGLGRRIASLFYESVLLCGALFFAGLAFSGAASGPLSGWPAQLFQAYIFLGLGLYFIWCWQRGGQTLPMKTWGLRLETASGQQLNGRRALIRYVLAWVSAAPAGAGFLWALVDRDGQFLHDRLAGTRIALHNPQDAAKEHASP